MKNNIPFIVLYSTTLVVIFYIFASLYTTSYDIIQALQYEKPLTKTDIVIFCQELAAYKTADDWGYKSCIEAIEESTKTTKVDLL